MTLVPARTSAKPVFNDDPWSDGRLGLIVIFVFFGVLGTWAALAPLDAGVFAPGYVKVSGNRTTVQHRDGGVISRVAVKEDDHVKGGQVLLDLSATELLANERGLAGQAIELQALRARLLAEDTGQSIVPRPPDWDELPSEYSTFADSVRQREQRELETRKQALDAQASVLGQRQEQLEARIKGYQDQITSLAKQSRLLGDELKGLRELLAKGYAPMNRVREQERLQAQIEGQHADLISSIAQAQEAIGEVHMQVISIREDRAQDIASQLRQTEAQLDETMPKLNSARAELERSRIRAPVSGTVVGLAFFNPGAVVRPGDRILDIVPDSQPLVIEAQIRPQDADDVHPGMIADIRLSAFEGRNIPHARGRVREVSADRLRDDRNGQWYFAAQIEVTPEEMTRIAATSGRADMALSAGLPVEVVVPLRRRTALQYLFEPLNQALWRSFREH